MKLQIDATVEYALGRHTNIVTYHDLQVNSPYNTYLNPGLPPGPICNPGMESIEAALHPKHTSYLYYVAKNDGTGETRFRDDDGPAAAKRAKEPGQRPAECHEIERGCPKRVKNSAVHCRDSSEGKMLPHVPRTYGQYTFFFHLLALCVILP